MVRVAIVCTSTKSTPWGKDTGYWLEELACPYIQFMAAGYEVEVFSINGGEPPLDQASLGEGFMSPDCHAFLKDTVAQSKLCSSLPVSSADASVFDVVYLPGGHGTAVDFEPSVALRKLVEGVYAAGGIIASVCHGPCGIVSAVLEDGTPLVAGKSVTGFTDVEEEAMGLLGVVPFSLEQRLKDLGGLYKSGESWGSNVCTDGRLVTGQNPASSKAVAESVISLLSA